MRKLSVLLISGLLFVVGCGTSERDEAVTFHTAIGESTRVVEAADFEFQVALLPVLRGEKVDPAGVRVALDGVRKALEEARERLSRAPVPDTSTARALADLHKKFLERHDHALATDFADAVKAADAKDLDPALRVIKVRDLFVRLQDAEYDDFQALRKAQGEFAKEHHLSVYEPNGDRALTFLTGLGVANGRLELGGKALGDALRPAMGDATPNRAAQGDRVEKSLESARATLAAVRRLVDALVVPPGKASKELASAEKDFLARQSEIFDQYFPQLVKLAHDPVLVPETRRERLDEVLKLMQVGEQAPMMRLQAAREEFLRENRLIRK